MNLLGPTPMAITLGRFVLPTPSWLSNFTFTFHFHALEKEMAIHSSVLAWRIPGMEEPGGLPSMGSHRVGHDWSNLAATAAAATVLSMLGIRNELDTWWSSPVQISDKYLVSLVLMPNEMRRQKMEIGLCYSRLDLSQTKKGKVTVNIWMHLTLVELFWWRLYVQ